MLLLGIEADTADLAPVSEVNAERSPIGEFEAHPIEIRRPSRNEPSHTCQRDSTEPPVNDRNSSPSGYHRPGPKDSVPLSAGYSLHIQQSLPKLAIEFVSVSVWTLDCLQELATDGWPFQVPQDRLGDARANRFARPSLFARRGNSSTKVYRTSMATIRFVGPRISSRICGGLQLQSSQFMTYSPYVVTAR